MSRTLHPDYPHSKNPTKDLDQLFYSLNGPVELTLVDHSNGTYSIGESDHRDPMMTLTKTYLDRVSYIEIMRWMEGFKVASDRQI